MNINWRPEETLFAELEQVFLSIGRDALAMDHYDLASMDDHTPLDWKAFITDNRVKKYITEEFKLIEQAELHKMISNSHSNKSIGNVQMVSTLSRRAEGKENIKEGPAYIYTYVPLSSEQEKAENIVKLTEDIFAEDGSKAYKIATAIAASFKDYLVLPKEMEPVVRDTVASILKSQYENGDDTDGT